MAELCAHTEQMNSKIICESVITNLEFRKRKTGKKADDIYRGNSEKGPAEFRTGHSEAGRGEASSAYDTAGNCGYYRNMPLESCEI